MSNAVFLNFKILPLLESKYYYFSLKNSFQTKRSTILVDSEDKLGKVCHGQT